MGNEISINQYGIKYTHFIEDSEKAERLLSRLKKTLKENRTVETILREIWNADIGNDFRRGFNKCVRVETYKNLGRLALATAFTYVFKENEFDPGIEAIGYVGVATYSLSAIIRQTNAQLALKFVDSYCRPSE